MIEQLMELRKTYQALLKQGASEEEIKEMEAEMIELQIKLRQEQINELRRM